MKQQRGFSLIEILIAGAIISAALLPIAGLSCTQRKMAAVNDEQLKTISIARAALNELAPLDFAQLQMRVKDIGGALKPIQEIEDYGLFRVEVIWTVIDETGLGQLTATVFDKEGKERQKLTKLVAHRQISMKSRPPLKTAFEQES